MQSEQSAVILSRGSVWNPQPFEPPYLIARGEPFPDGSTARIDYTDSTGATILTADGGVEPDAIRFLIDPSDGIDDVPAGANFEVTLETLEGDYKIRYGKVIRREVQWTAPTAKAVTPHSFTDSFQRTALGRKWVTVAGRVRIFDNSLGNLPNGVATENALFTKAAIRYYQQFTSDSIRLRANIVNPLHLQSGKTAFAVCCDALMTCGLVMQLETGMANNWVHMGVIDGAPDRIAYQGQPIRNDASNGDNYTVAYSQQSKALAVYKGDSLTPLGSWKDEAEMVPHGPGYRYMGLLFEASLLSSGIQVTSIAAMDAL